MRWSSLTVCLAALVAGIVIAGCSDKGSNPASSSPPPQQTQDVSFKNQIVPYFINYGCDGCHGGNGGLDVQTVAQLLRGGIHGPAVVAGKADSSIIIKKLSSSPPFGDRMPRGGPYMADSTIQILKTWINQGAKNN
ncbi:MAG: hypothetical protein NTZ35_18085 [Ignavibacteriales bacterium]|nr:hypothetical protein [Ignavibacteriales bacterium]